MVSDVQILESAILPTVASYAIIQGKIGCIIEHGIMSSVFTETKVHTLLVYSTVLHALETLTLTF